MTFSQERSLGSGCHSVGGMQRTTGTAAGVRGAGSISDIAPENPLPPDPIEPEPPIASPQGLDAVIDLSSHNAVSDFRLVRASSILGVIHKASEGDFYADPLCAERRSQAEAAGLLWGTYHFGKGDFLPGAQQAAFFLEFISALRQGPSLPSTWNSTKAIPRTR